LGELAGLSQGQLCLWPAVEVLQREDAVVHRSSLDIEAKGALVRAARVVPKHAQGPLDAIKRGEMVAPDAMAQPQFAQGARCCEGVIGLLSGGDGLAGSRLH
jgi:hypothetical protein